MAELIHLDYTLLPIINRFGINLGFGEKNIEDVCEENNVNLNFFLEIVNTFHDTNYFPEKNLQEFSLQTIIEYLKKTHDYFFNEKLPKLDNYINTLKNEHADLAKINLVNNFYIEYRHEFIEHITFENKKVYPYILSLEELYRRQERKIYCKEEFTIKNYAMQHQNVEEKLFDLKNIIIKYLPPSQNANLINAILFELFELEHELNDHQRIEDKVLIPKVIAMEQIIYFNCS